MKILVLAPRFPYPLDKGDKLRLYHQIVELSKRHEVYLFALSHEKVRHEHYDHLHTVCTAVDYVVLRWWERVWGVLKSFFTGKPLQLGYWSSHRARCAYADWERQVQPDVVYCQMVRTIPTVSASKYTKVLDFQDALSLNTRRRMERTHGPMRWLLGYEYRALQRTEREALGAFSTTTVISDIDRMAISPKVNIVLNGVDTDYFKVESVECVVGSTRGQMLPTTHYPLPTYTILFTGNMAYAPNVDAARYLVEDIMPIVWKCFPDATVLIAGADPKPAVRALADKVRVTVSGRLPDIRTAYASAKVFVAPMRIGSGMQNKLLEAMAMCRPCVTTTLAATPLGATSGEQLLVGDSPAQLAQCICKLLDSEELRNSMAGEGRRFVQERYSWSAAVKPLEEIFNGLVESK